MPFELAFHPEALREWRQLTPGIREQFKNKLAELLVLVVAVGKRERNAVYRQADQR
jgi:mRNA interferase RelE/StbE